MTSFDAEVKVSVACDYCGSKETCGLAADVRRAVAEMPPRVFRSEVVSAEPFATLARPTLLVYPVVQCAFRTLPSMPGMPCTPSVGQRFALLTSPN